MGKTKKANDKLPRGSFYTVKVGHMFYAGEEPVKEIVEVNPNDPVLTYFHKGKVPTDQYRSYMERSWYRWTTARGVRADRDRRKGGLAKYLKRPEIKQKEQELRPTGAFFPKLVEEESQAKKFRKKDMADSTCEKLKRQYEGLDVAISVQLNEGDNL